MARLPFASAVIAAAMRPSARWRDWGVVDPFADADTLVLLLVGGLVAGVFTIPDSPSLDFGSADFLIEMVLLPAWGGFAYAQGGLLLNCARTSQHLTVAPSVDVASNVDLGTGPPHLFGIWRHGATLELIVDRTRTTGSLTTETFGGKVVLGDKDGLETQVNVFKGAYAEVVVAKGTFSTSTVAGVELYLINRFGL